MKKDTRRKIIDACLEIFGEKGCRFTLQDLTEYLKINKTTFYRYFQSKEEVLKIIIDEVSDEVHTRQREIYKDKSLSTKEKLLMILTVEPSSEKIIKPEKLYELEKHYSDVYNYFMDAYEKEWEIAEKLLAKGIKEGIFKKFNIGIIKGLLQNGMQMFYKGDFLDSNGLTYKEALYQMLTLIFDGIAIDKE